jgi:hypothetical protein
LFLDAVCDVHLCVCAALAGRVSRQTNHGEQQPASCSCGKATAPDTVFLVGEATRL